MVPSLTPMFLSSDNVTGLLIAVFGGAAASLIAGYLARPKTKAEASAANATADVSMSGDAREWANFWATKAQEAQAQVQSCESAKDAAEEGERKAREDFATLKQYTLLLEQQVTRDGATMLPPLPDRVRLLLHGTQRPMGFQPDESPEDPQT